MRGAHSNSWYELMRTAHPVSEWFDHSAECSYRGPLVSFPNGETYRSAHSTTRGRFDGARTIRSGRSVATVVVSNTAMPARHRPATNRYGANSSGVHLAAAASPMSTPPVQSFPRKMSHAPNVASPPTSRSVWRFTITSNTYPKNA